MNNNGKKNIVVIGGGTGTYTVLSGLKKHTKNGISLSAIVTVADSGGSTGRLRDEFGYLPVGDFRMALAALADDNDLLRRLFLYRFDRGNGLSGHNFGNLFLVAMTDILGSEERAIEFAGRVLRVSGKVIPVTTKDVTLMATFENGATIEGEDLIDEPNGRDGTLRIKRLWIDPPGEITKDADRAIRQADLIVLGPGDLYTSTLANIVVDGVPQALRASRARLACITNLMSKYGQTHGFTTGDFVGEITKYAGRAPDYCLVNTAPLPSDIIERYREQHEFPIEDSAGNFDGEIVRGDFLSPEEITKPGGDVLHRSLIRHDSDKLATALIRLLELPKT